MAQNCARVLLYGQSILPLENKVHIFVPPGNILHENIIRVQITKKICGFSVKKCEDTKRLLVIM